MALGVALLVGGLRYHNQEFNARAARVYSSMMLLAVISLAGPGAFERVFSAAEHRPAGSRHQRPAGRDADAGVYALYLISCWAPTADEFAANRRPATATARARLEHDAGRWAR